MKIAVAALAVILQEDPFHDIGNLCFNRLEQYDQILHGTVAGTDIHAADFFIDGLLHAFQSVLNGFDSDRFPAEPLLLQQFRLLYTLPKEAVHTHGSAGSDLLLNMEKAAPYKSGLLQGSQRAVP